jgi:hypothetical protein
MLASIGFNSYWYQKFTFIEYNFFKVTSTPIFSIILS